MSADRGVRIEGLDQYLKGLKKMDREWGKAMRQVHLKVSILVSGRAAAAAPSRAKSGIKPNATQKAAFVKTSSGRRGDVLGVLWGMSKRSGWYAASRYSGSSGRQFEPWVGNQWDPGARSGKPYFIGEAINESVDDVIDIYGDEIEKLAAQAFPEGGGLL